MHLISNESAKKNLYALYCNITRFKQKDDARKTNLFVLYINGLGWVG